MLFSILLWQMIKRIINFANQIKSADTFFIIFCSLVVFFVSFKFFNFPFVLNNEIILETDGIFTQTQIQSLAEGAIFQRTPNLGYPFGYSQWTVPQFSIIESIFLWLISNLFPFSNFGLLIAIGVFITFLNSYSLYLLAKYYDLNSFVKVLFIVIGAFSPYALNSITHPHVMKIFTIPIYLILLKIIYTKKTISVKEFIIFIIFLLSSSLYWVNVFFAIFFVLLFIIIINKLFRQSDSDSSLKIILKLFLINFTILFIHIYLFFINRDITGQNGRGRWHSDLFSGKFTDFLLSSPLINYFIPNTQVLYDGASTEIKANLVGLPLIITFAYLIIQIVSFENHRSLDLKLITQISIIGTLFFVVGGLSNLQSAIFVFFGTTSPMRTWSRVSILLSIIGLLLLFNYLKKYSKINFITAMLFIILSFFDLIYLPKPLNTTENWKTHEYFNAINFIQKNLQPCPILQLPIDTYLVPQGALDMAVRYYWTDQIPFIVLPEYKWTAATYTGTKGWTELTEIKPLLNQEDLKNYSNKFCAILFDINFSKYQIDRKATLPNTDLGWPGVEIVSEVKPAFEDSRFRVYILNDSKKY